jgi:hypothetical protein
MTVVIFERRMPEFAERLHGLGAYVIVPLFHDEQSARVGWIPY